MTQVDSGVRRSASDGLRKAIAVAALGLLLLVSVPFIIVAVSGCGGQCSAPYLLNVHFRPGTTLSAAWLVIQRCEHDPIVVSGTGEVSSPNSPIALPAHDHVTPLVEGQLRTTYIGRSPQTQPLLTCLDRSPVVAYAAWPD